MSASEERPDGHGRFLSDDATPSGVFTPEDFSDEQRMIARTAARFVKTAVLPRLPRILSLDYATIREALRKAAELGLLALETPEAYGGLGLDCVSGCLSCEQLARDASFVVSVMAHSGMGTLPILHFGTEEQKRRYLPRFASGEWISSYALSEASSASDALNARTKAVPSTDGSHWLLNGEKMWLTNAGIADVYVTFAKVNGLHLSAFIVEKGMPGVTLGPEEKKTGLKGSSTRRLVLSNARVPQANLLGKVGRGHRIAFSTLHPCRLKLAAANVAACRYALESSIEFTSTRTAFGRPITSFGLTRHKLAQMVILTYVGEALVYRTAGMLDRKRAGAGDDTARVVRAIEECEVECSIAKVWCSEALGSVTDEQVQMFGASGYIEDYPAERSWRDARVSRIFEGTNEINRLRIAGRLVQLALAGPGSAVAEPPTAATRRLRPPDSLVGERLILSAAKQAALVCLRAAVRREPLALDEEQEVLAGLADIAMDIYALESALLRTWRRASAASEQELHLGEAAVRCFAHDALDRLEVRARGLLSFLEEGEPLRCSLRELRRLTRRRPVDLVSLRRRIADVTVALGRYPLS